MKKSILNCLLLSLALTFSSIAVAETYFASYVFPITAPRLSSAFGFRIHPVRRTHKHHSGIDLAVPNGTPIRSIANGTVVFADKYAGYGNFISILHDNGLTSHYGHCSEIKTSIGKKVTAGEIIGTVGSTGVVTGPHLHFEIRNNGKAENPEKYLTGLRVEAQG